MSLTEREDRRPATVIRVRPLPIGSLLALLLVFGLAGCRPGADPTPTPSVRPSVSPEVTETPVAPPINILPTSTPTAAPPTATPLPPATPSGLWSFDLGRGRQALLWEGDRQLRAVIERSGDAISAELIDANQSTAIRFEADGNSIEEHADRTRIVSSVNGESRFYQDLSDLEGPRLVLEHQGVEVNLEGTRARRGVAFAPSGERLLTVSERPGVATDEVVRTFSVHTTSDGRLRMQFEHRALTNSPVVAHWSPSTRYVSDQGIEGLFVRDTLTGRAWRLGPSGSTRWSPIADRLLVVTDFDRLAIVNIPDLDGVDLGVADPTSWVRFDRSGQLALHTSYAGAEPGADPTTQAFAVDDGIEVAVWSGLDLSVAAIGGPDPVIALERGIAAVFSAEDCTAGFVIYHPDLDADGSCISGANPRWSPTAAFLVFARDRQLILLSASTGSERVLVRGTPPPDVSGGATASWSPDGSWLLIQWSPQAASAESQPESAAE